MKKNRALVETIKVPGGNFPDAKEILAPLNSAVLKYGVDNVRIYISSFRDDWGSNQNYLKIYCYK